MPIEHHLFDNGLPEKFALRDTGERNGKDFKIGAEGGIRTRTARATAPSRQRVYQFHHFGFRLFPTWSVVHLGTSGTEGSFLRSCFFAGSFFAFFVSFGCSITEGAEVTDPANPCGCVRCAE